MNDIFLITSDNWLDWITVFGYLALELSLHGACSPQSRYIMKLPSSSSSSFLLRVLAYARLRQRAFAFVK